MIEPAEVARHRRQLGAMIRAAGDDPESFAIIRSLLADANEQLSDATVELRSQGFSWADIARPLGLSRQGMQKTYGKAGV